MLDAAAKRTNPWVAIGGEANDHTVLTSVNDSGNGIPKALAEKLFQPFFTAKEVDKGNGLGLSISQCIAGQHRGRLYFDENCANTHLVLDLPLKQNELGSKDSAA